MEPPKTFTCFHCWEIFEVTDFASQLRAREHFGATPDAQPICRIQQEDRRLIWRVRRLEEQLAARTAALNIIASGFQGDKLLAEWEMSNIAAAAVAK